MSLNLCELYFFIEILYLVWGSCLGVIDWKDLTCYFRGVVHYFVCLDSYIYGACHSASSSSDRLFCRHCLQYGHLASVTMNYNLGQSILKQSFTCTAIHYCCYYWWFPKWLVLYSILRESSFIPLFKNLVLLALMSQALMLYLSFHMVHWFFLLQSHDF